MTSLEPLLGYIFKAMMLSISNHFNVGNFAKILSQPFPELDSVLVPLVQRELSELVDAEYCFQFELIRRRFIK